MYFVAFAPYFLELSGLELDSAFFEVATNAGLIDYIFRMIFDCALVELYLYICVRVVAVVV